VKIIVRTCGERTTDKCIKLAEKHGSVEVIEARPFGESVRQTYKRIAEMTDKWVAVIDADVILFSNNCIEQAEIELNNLQASGKKIFCLDGRTIDKILMTTRRAGVHIYNADAVRVALNLPDNFINTIDTLIKPESAMRERMAIEGYKTHVGDIVFGTHDYEQYYYDLWRKTICQTVKLKNMIKNKPDIWKKHAAADSDYAVIYAAHQFARRYEAKGYPLKITIDKDNDYNARENIEYLGLQEKGNLI
jgi:hypothetical protein